MEQNKIQEAARQLAERSKNPVGNKSEGRKGCLVVIDGKPPVGDNTTLMLYTVKFRAVDEKKPTAYFSLEESNQQVVNRLIAIITGIDLQKITDGTLSEDEW
nr:DnaB-like helicase C-terminal domain-containing protein [Prevotella sp.]